MASAATMVIGHLQHTIINRAAPYPSQLMDDSVE